MGQQIIKQPNGLYAVWSSSVDAVVMWDCTPDEILNHWIEQEKERLTKSLKSIIEKLDAGNAKACYFQFAMTWDEALKQHESNHGKLS